MASKFKIKVKIQGFELEVEGSREDVSELTDSVGEQLSGLLRPGGTIIEGQIAPAPPLPSLTQIERKGRRKRTAPSGASASSGEAAVAIDFRHDTGTFGMPRQDWNTAQKAMWLIYVLKNVAVGDSFASRQLAETFNKHFKQSGMIKSFNVTRDLGKAKAQETPAQVGEDTTKSPSLWYLTTEGERRVAAMIAEARGGQQAAA